MNVKRPCHGASPRGGHSSILERSSEQNDFGTVLVSAVGDITKMLHTVTDGIQFSSEQRRSINTADKRREKKRDIKNRQRPVKTVSLPQAVAQQADF